MDPACVQKTFGFTALFGLLWWTNYAESDKYMYTRQPDKSFPTSTILFGRNVTCGQHKPGLFPSKTWSCTDIKVDGHRLTFTYMPGLGAAKRECGETKGRNDLAALCNHMLLAQGIQETLWSAFVSQASCHPSRGPRILLRNTSTHHQWNMAEAGKGYIKSIQCMVLS